MQPVKGKIGHIRASSFAAKLPAIGGIETEPISVFLLHKLRIQDRSLISREGKVPAEPFIYGHSTLKDQFRAYSERFKPNSLHRSASSLEAPLRRIEVKRKRTGVSGSLERISTHTARLSKLSDAIIDQCDQFRTVDGRYETNRQAKWGKTAEMRSLGRGQRRQVRGAETDPSNLVLRFERNNQTHRKRMIQRSRSFLQRRS